MTESRIDRWQGYVGTPVKDYHVMVNEGRESTQSMAEPELSKKELAEPSHSPLSPSRLQMQCDQLTSLLKWTGTWNCELKWVLLEVALSRVWHCWTMSRQVTNTAHNSHSYFVNHRYSLWRPHWWGFLLSSGTADFLQGRLLSSYCECYLEPYTFLF